MKRLYSGKQNRTCLNMRFMFLGGPGENQDVIQADEHKMIHEVLEDVVNQSLENNGNISQCKWHHQILELIKLKAIYPLSPSLILTGWYALQRSTLLNIVDAFNNLKAEDKKAAGIYFCVTHGSQCMVSSFVCFLYKEESCTKRRGRGPNDACS